MKTKLTDEARKFYKELEQGKKKWDKAERLFNTLTDAQKEEWLQRLNDLAVEKN